MFEIGGVDMETTTDHCGQPIIPASSLKGVLRRMTKEKKDKDETAKAIAKAYQVLLIKYRNENEKRLTSGQYELEPERTAAMKKRFETEIEKASVENLFGIQGFHDTPKLLFQDLKLKKCMDDWYSLDSKNKIELNGLEISANPRSYKTVRPGITFHGEIILHQIEILQVRGIGEFIKNVLLQFNDGSYRLGNSGSRGYGHIEVSFD